MANQRRSGTLFFKINGLRYDAKGNFTYNLGREKREAIIGTDAVHGYKAMPQVPFIEGELTDSTDLDLNAVLTIDDVTATLELANGKVIVLRNAWYAGDGNVQTEEGNIQLRLEGLSADEVA